MARVALCVLVLVLAAACGNDAGTEEGPTESVPAQTEPQAEPTPEPVPAPEAITEEQSGGVFTLAVGGETSLRLSSEWTWSDPLVAGEAVQLQRVDHLQDPGFLEWIVMAVSPGTATIVAAGTPACAGQDDCLGGPISFRATITVE